MLHTVKKILDRKKLTIESVPPEVNVYDALKIMAEKNIGSLVVMKDGKYLGIFTERDYARKVILKDKSSKETAIGEVISDDLPSVKSTNVLDDCMLLMSERNVRYLPVIENDILIGILSIKDVVDETLIAHRETIEHLKSYISS